MIPSSCCPPYRRHETPTNPAGDRARHRALTPRHGTRSQAVLNHDGQGADNDLSATYRDACAIWFARLTQGERWRLATVLAAYDRGAEADAEQFAAALPPAPRFPVS